MPTRVPAFHAKHPSRRCFLRSSPRPLFRTRTGSRPPARLASNGRWRGKRSGSRLVPPVRPMNSTAPNAGRRHRLCRLPTGRSYPRQKCPNVHRERPVHWDFQPELVRFFPGIEAVLVEEGNLVTRRLVPADGLKLANPEKTRLGDPCFPAPILGLPHQDVAWLHVAVSHPRLMNAVKAAMQGNHEVEQKLGGEADRIVFHELIERMTGPTSFSPSAGRFSPSSQS